MQIFYTIHFDNFLVSIITILYLFRIIRVKTRLNLLTYWNK